MGIQKTIKMKNIKIQNIFTILFFISSLLLVQSLETQAQANGLEEKPLNVENLHSGLDISEDKTSFIEESEEATTEAKTEEVEEAKEEEAVEDKEEENVEDKAEENVEDESEVENTTFVEEHEEATEEAEEAEFEVADDHVEGSEPAFV